MAWDKYLCFASSLVNSFVSASIASIRLACLLEVLWKCLRPSRHRRSLSPSAFACASALDLSLKTPFLLGALAVSAPKMALDIQKRWKKDEKRLSLSAEAPAHVRGTLDSPPEHVLELESLLFRTLPALLKTCFCFSKPSSDTSDLLFRLYLFL